MAEIRVRVINGKGDATATPPTGAGEEDWRGTESDFLANGGIVNTSDFEVTELATPGMVVDVNEGTAWVDNSDFQPNSFATKFYDVQMDDTEQVNISSNNSGQTRIDIIAIKIDKTAAPDDDASNVASVVAVEGTPGAGAPALPDNHLALAQVTVGDGATSITNANISDLRVRIKRGTYEFEKVQADELQIGATQVVDGILNENDMSTDSANALATQASIKAYVDSEIVATEAYVDNQIASIPSASNVKFVARDPGGFDLSYTGTAQTSLQTLDLSAIVSANAFSVLLMIRFNANNGAVRRLIIVPGDGSDSTFRRVEVTQYVQNEFTSANVIMRLHPTTKTIRYRQDSAGGSDSVGYGISVMGWWETV